MVYTIDDIIRINRKRTAALFGAWALIFGVPCGLFIAAANGWPAGDSPWPLLGCVTLLIAMVALVVWRAERIIVRLTKAQPISSRLASPRLYDAVINASIAAGVPTPKIYMITDDRPNAFAAGTGFRPESVLVGATTGLLEQLDDAELQGVMAHEIAHIKHEDSKIMSISSGLLFIVVCVCQVIAVMLIVAGATADAASSRSSGDGGGGSAGAFVGVILLEAFVILSTLVHLGISRKREYMADAGAVDLTRYPEGMVSALRQFEVYDELQSARSQGEMGEGFMGALQMGLEILPKACVSHLFINEVGPVRRHRWTDLFSTHPATWKRIEALEAFTNGQRHTRRPMQQEACA